MHLFQHPSNLSRCLISPWPLRPYLPVLACWLLLPFVSVAQQFSAKFTTDQYLVEAKIWGQKDGLTSLVVGGLFQDSRNFVWIQNYNSLLQFDGRQFTPIDTIEFTEKYHSNHPFNPVDIDEDIHGNIWRYFQHLQEVRIYDPAANRHYPLIAYLGMDTLPPIPKGSRMISMNRIIYIIDDSGGTIWAYDGTFKKVFQDVANGYYRNNPTELYHDYKYVYYLPGPDKQFWIIHRELGVILCDERGAPLVHYSELLPSIYHFFIAAGNQLYYYPRTSAPGQPPNIYQAGSPEAPLSKAPALHYEFFRRNFLATPPGDASLAVEGLNGQNLTLWKKNGGSQNLLEFVWDIINYPNEISGELVIQGLRAQPCQTGNGDIWFNTNMGLVQIHFQKRRFESYFRGCSFRNIAWLDEKTFYGLYYGKAGIQINTFHLGDVPRISPLTFTGKNGFTYIGMKNRDIWVGYGGFLAHYNQAKQFIREFAPPTPSNIKIQESYSPLFLANGHILYCTSIGLIEIDGAGNSRFLLEDTPIECLMQDSKGDVWAGTAKGIWHLATRTMFLGALPGNKPLSINYIHEATDGRFWLATNQGLVHWKPFGQNIEQFTMQEGLSDNTLHAVYPGAGAWLWLSSNNGIMAFNSQTKRVRSFFVEDGLAHNEQNRRAHSLGPDGRLYFGGINGITRFDPKDISFDGGDAGSMPLVFLQNISYAHSNKGSSTELFRGLVSQVETPFSLPARAFQLNVNIAQPFFNNEDHRQIEWRIAGHYPNWTPIPASGFLTISGLPAGRFHLEIRSKDLRHTENIPSLVIPFKKAYMYYQLPLFWLLVVVLVFLALLLFIRRRVRLLNTRNILLKEMVQERTQELERSNANILQQKEQLERIDASKTQLFNNISHEFRTPLSLIQGHAEALLMSASSALPTINKTATSIKEQAIQLNRMIQEIMDLSKLQQGVIQLKKEPVEWISFLQTEFYLFESQAQQKQLDYQFRIEPDEKVYVSIDRQKVERVLHNLISNAIKFTPDAGRILVYCTIRETEIEVVADTGPGILPEEQALIFNRYFQGSAPRQSSQTGYGIGLALCREYVELMQGRLWVESRPGEGASFFVVFHREPASAPAQTPLERATADKVHPRTFAHLLHNQGQSHLLVVEDNEQIQLFLMDILAEEYRISTAANGEEALTVLAREPDIDLILSDVMMPVMDGFTLLQKTRSHPVWGFIPFMMITALTAEEGKLQALRLGVDAFLTKPFEIVELKTQIQNLIRNQELRKSFLKQPASASSQEQVLDTSAPAQGAAISQEEQPTEQSYDEQWMNELQAIVLKNMGKVDFKVSDLAFQMHISERTLRNYLKTYTGLAPSDFLQKARLDQAHKLAQNKKYRTIAEIAYAVGFKDAKHFSKLFTKEFGKSPADYLK